MATVMTSEEVMRIIKCFSDHHPNHDPIAKFELLVRHPQLLTHMYGERTIIFLMMAWDLTEDQWQVICQKYWGFSREPNANPELRNPLPAGSMVVAAASPYPWLRRGAAIHEAGKLLQNVPASAECTCCCDIRRNGVQVSSLADDCSGGGR
jgi:hypothetical protein